MRGRIGSNSTHSHTHTHSHKRALLTSLCSVRTCRHPPRAQLRERQGQLHHGSPLVARERAPRGPLPGAGVRASTCVCVCVLCVVGESVLVCVLCVSVCACVCACACVRARRDMEGREWCAQFLAGMAEVGGTNARVLTRVRGSKQEHAYGAPITITPRTSQSHPWRWSLRLATFT